MPISSVCFIFQPISLLFYLFALLKVIALPAIAIDSNNLFIKKLFRTLGAQIFFFSIVAWGILIIIRIGFYIDSRTKYYWCPQKSYIIFDALSNWSLLTFQKQKLSLFTYLLHFFNRVLYFDSGLLFYIASHIVIALTNVATVIVVTLLRS